MGTHPIHINYGPYCPPNSQEGVPTLYSISQQAKAANIVFMFSDSALGSVSAANRIPVNHVTELDITVASVTWKSARSNYWYTNTPIWACAGYENPVNPLEFIWQLPYPVNAIGDGSPAGGDLSGTYPNPSVTESAVTQHEGALTITESQISDLQSYALASHTHSLTDLTDVSTAAVTNRFALMANGSNYVGRALEVADISDAGALAALNTVGTSQIDNSAVTYAKIQNVAQDRILGRVSSGSGDAEELTGAQVRTLIGQPTYGTFIPAIAFGGGTTDITYGTRTGQAIETPLDDGKIHVWFNINIEWTNKGSSTGVMTVTGLNRTANSSYECNFSWDDVTPTVPFIAGTGHRGRVLSGTTTISLMKYLDTSSGYVQLSDTDISGTTLTDRFLRLTGWYIHTP